MPKKPLIAALVVIGVLIAAALVFALLHQRGGPPVVQGAPAPPSGPPITQGPTQPSASRPITQAEVPPAPSMPQAPPQEKVPPEVVQYIEFVKRVEAKRKEMRIDFTPAMEMLKAAYGAQLGLLDEDSIETEPPKVAGGYNKYVQEWNQLVQTFDTVQAPEPCRQFAGAYRQALGSYVTAMTRIQAAMVQGDINTLESMRRKTQPDIDGLLREADSQLAQLTKRYHLEKTFTVSADAEVDTILGH